MTRGIIVAGDRWWTRGNSVKGLITSTIPRIRRAKSDVFLLNTFSKVLGAELTWSLSTHLDYEHLCLTECC